MRMRGNTILITGGATGIGLALARDEAEIVIGMANNIKSDPMGMFKRMNA